MIETTVYFYNKSAHIAAADELNALASAKGVQVSRWINNSRGRQVATYIVHTGERASRSDKQEGVIFKTSLDSGYGRKIYDETGLMAECLSAVMEIEKEPKMSEKKYQITADIFTADEPVTVDEARSLIDDWDLDGWSVSIETDGSALEIHAVRTEDYDEDVHGYTPVRSISWEQSQDGQLFWVQIGHAV